MQDFTAELEELKANIKSKNPPKGGIVFYGSSSFRLWSTLSEDLLRDDIANLAFGGSTIEACVHYFEEIVVPYNPSSIVFYGGDNDIGNGKSAAEVYTFYLALHEKVRKHFPLIPFTFLSIKPSPSRGNYLPEIIASNELIYLETRAQEHSSYLEIFKEMVLNNHEIDGSYFIEDDLHLNKKGYSLWANVLNENKNIWVPAYHL